MAQVETRGLEGLTLQALADELDYSPAALYRYFPSKDALVAELQRRVVLVLDRKLAEVEARVAEGQGGGNDEGQGDGDHEANDGDHGDALVALAAAGLFYAEVARSAPQAFGLLAVSLGDPRRLIDDASAGSVLDAAQPMFARIAAAAERAVSQRRLEAGAALDRAVMLWASMHGVLQLRKLTRIAPDLIDADRLAEQLIETLLVGWGASRDDVRAAVETVHSRGLALASLDADDLAATDDVAA